MKKSNFTQEPALFAPKRAHVGETMPEVCREKGISEVMFYVRTRRFANIRLFEERELRQLRDENVGLRRLVADLTLNRHVLQDVINKICERSRARMSPIGYPTASGSAGSAHAG